MFVSEAQRKTALGTFTLQSERKFYQAISTLFKPMPKPVSGEWLYSIQEKHQAFSDYRLPYYNPVTPQRKTIYIQPFDEFDPKFIAMLCQFCQYFYLGLIVKCLPSINTKTVEKEIRTREEPILEFQKENGKVVKRDPYYGKQYLAQDYMAVLQKQIPKDAYCVVGITLKDIYAGKNWNYVYGWASYVNRVGIFSFLRWDEAFAEGKTQKIDWNHILYPSLRVMIHEIGHMFGVTHCVYYHCLMNGFMDIDQNYRRPFQFCPICLKKLASNIKFDKRKRYIHLLEYCKTNQIGRLPQDGQLYGKLLEMAEKQ